MTALENAVIGILPQDVVDADRANALTFGDSIAKSVAADGIKESGRLYAQPREHFGEWTPQQVSLFRQRTSGIWAKFDAVTRRLPAKKEANKQYYSCRLCGTRNRKT